MKKYNHDKQMTSVWHIGLCVGDERLKGSDGKKAHSTQKPEELLKRVILSTTKQGDIVLDPFFGTGTTGAVAKKLKRHFIGIEKEEKYINVAQNRLDNITSYLSEADWIEPKKEKQSYIQFETLVKEGIIKEGERLYAKKPYIAVATVIANGVLEFKDKSGSIHQIGSMIQQSPSCNGWMFWFIIRDSQAILIDIFRKNYKGGKNEI